MNIKRHALVSRLDLAVLLGVTAAVLLAQVAAFGQDCAVVRADVVRLHILADSDRDADQQVKLRVRDRILADVGEVFATPRNQADARTAATRQIPAIRAAAQSELAACGVDAPVSAEVCNMYFNTREYDGLFLPAGNYDAVRATIGSGAGKNWWCVMYPPICVPAATAETEEFLAQSHELAEIQALGDASLFRPKLAVVELFERFIVRSDTVSPEPPSSDMPA